MAAQIPSPLARFSDEQGRPTREMYEWMQKLEALARRMETFGLGDLSDVDTSGATNGQQLTWVSADSAWKPGAAS